MHFKFLNSERGVTLVELIVATAISSLILLFVVAGGVFVKDYLSKWKKRDLLTEEMVFLHKEISGALESARSVSLCDDSLVCHSHVGSDAHYRWAKGSIRKGSHELMREGFTLDTLAIAPYGLQDSVFDSILHVSGRPDRVPFFELLLVLSDQNGQADTLRSTIRNEYSYGKFAKKHRSQ